MTRIEEIQKLIDEEMGIDNYGSSDYQVGVCDGVRLADKTMIEKACKYLRQSLYNTPIFEHDEDENPVNYVCASCCDSVEEFINNFSKAMLEEE